jgi:hypothetical protein
MASHKHLIAEGISLHDWMEQFCKAKQVLAYTDMNAPRTMHKLRQRMHDESQLLDVHTKISS